MKPIINVCSVSGGKDSTALYLLMKEFHGTDFLPVFADTGHEHPVTVNYVKNLHLMAGGPEVQIVKADFTKAMRMRRQSRIVEVRKFDRGSAEYEKALQFARKMRPTGNRFLDMMVWKNAVPTGKNQFCSEHLKLWPQKLFLMDKYPDHDWIIHSGIRAKESRARSTRQPFAYHTFFDALEVLPLVNETEEWVFEYLEANGVPPNPLYAIGNSRVGCYPCIHANKDQLLALPDWAWDRLVWFQDVLGIRWFTDMTVEEAREWCKTSRGGVQYNMFKTAPDDAPSCVSGWSNCE